MNAADVRERIAEKLDEAVRATPQNVELVCALLAALTGHVEDINPELATTMYGFSLDRPARELGDHVHLRAMTSRIARVRSFMLSRSCGLALAPVSLKLGDVELLGNGGGGPGLPLRAALGLYHGLFFRPGVDITLTCRVDRMAQMSELRLGMLCELYDYDGKPYPRNTYAPTPRPVLRRTGESS
jgi:hypothetical protein